MARIDLFGQEILNGDFIVSHSSSVGTTMGVMKDVDTLLRVGISGNITTKVYKAGVNRNISGTRNAVKIPDELLVKIRPELFETVNDIREALKLPTNRELKYHVNEKEDLTRILEHAIK